MKKVLIVVMMFVLVLSLVACTESNTDTTGDDALPTLTMATNAEFPPFEYIDEAGEPAGFDVDLFYALCEEMGYTPKVEDMLFDAVVISVQEGKADVGIAGLSINPERLEEVDFTENYYIAGQAIIVLNDSDIQAVADLDGKSVGVQLGTTADTAANSGDYGTLDVQQYNKNADALQDLVNGRLNAVIMDNQTAKAFLATNSDMKMLDELLTEESYAIAVAKDNTELKDALNAALTVLQENGTIDALLEKHELLENAE